MRLSSEQACKPATPHPSKGERGFSLLEVLLALGVLSVVTVQVLSVTSTGVSMVERNWSNIQATWALRSAHAQLEYLVDALGYDELPNGARYAWAGNPEYQVTVALNEVDIEASKLLLSAIRIGNAMEGKEPGGEEDPVEKAINQFGSMLDSQVPKDMYKQAQVTVAWPDGTTQRTMEGGMLLVNNRVIQFQHQEPDAGGGGGNQGGQGGNQGGQGGNQGGQGGNQGGQGGNQGGQGGNQGGQGGG